MDELFTRFWENLVGRVGGPMTFRLFVQPLVATIFAIRDGIKDARQGRPAFLYAMLAGRINRRQLLREVWDQVGKIFIVAILIDLIYQVIVFRWFYPLEAVVTAAVLAFLPYMVIRGLVNRIARHWSPAKEIRMAH